MPSLIFVHGTGVRRRGYDPAFDSVRKALGGRSDLTVEPCYWGDLGATVASSSVPGAGARVEPETESDVAVWSVLYDDPLYELRILGLRETRITVGFGELPPGKELASTAKKYRASQPAEVELREAELAEHFEDARRSVVHDPVFERALETAGEALEEYRAAIARAWVAEAIRRRRTDQPDALPVPAARRDDIVRLLIEDLGGRELAFSDWARDKIFHLGTRLVHKRRGDLTGSASPIAGDILLYQARGAPIRARIRDAVECASPPVVLMAHSLGGVAAVDLLVEQELPVELLVTVGSQGPFFHEIGALSSLERGAELPQHFPPWLNIYDPRDFLSYVGAQVFSGRVTDVEVDNGQPFPISHSAYWTNDDFWVAIGRELP